MTAPVLGLNFGTHDAAAAIVAGGAVIAAAEEERFSRVKHTKAFPTGAIAFCLRQAGVDVNELGEVALFVDPKRQFLLPFANQYHGFPASLGSLASDLAKFRNRRRLPDTIRESALFRQNVRVKPVVHHQAHAASAYLTSPFEDAVVVTIDGRGEYETACIFEGHRGRLKHRHSMIYPHSIGYLYSMVTRYLGFRPQRDEYKVMGLAAYGSPRLAKTVGRLARFDARTGSMRLTLRYFDHHSRPSHRRQLYSNHLVRMLGPPRLPDDPITDRHQDIAFAIQGLTEQLIGSYVLFARTLVPAGRLCLAGGVALNSVANAAVITAGGFDEVYVHPAANDAGTSIGAALLAADASGDRRILRHAFLGPEPDEPEIKTALTALSGCHVREVPDPHESAARLLHEGKIIGWFQGRMEFGPRALGNRSILAAATHAGVSQRINALIKRREHFRPLAPAVLEEYADAYFDVHPAGRHVYPFMLATAPARHRARSLIPAVVHVDGSARVQIVSQSANPGLWRLIDAYRLRSGIAAVLNTSFNSAEEPIVCSPADAVRTFTACGLDALVIGNYVVEPANG